MIVPVQFHGIQRILLLLPALLLTVSSCTEPDHAEPMTRSSVTSTLTESIRSDSIEACITWLQNMGTRFCMADNRRDVAVAIRDRFIQMGYTGAALDSFWLDLTRFGITFQGWQYNVIAVLEGKTYADSVCIVGAHYDDFSPAQYFFTDAPGANDNASGVAAVIEIARVMKECSFIPDLTIKFIAFSAEEAGLYGSLSYAGKASESQEKIKLMLNNDMIACEKDRGRTRSIVNILDYDNSHDLRLLAQKLCLRHTDLNYVNYNRYREYSDSYPFSLYGFRAIFFTSYLVDNTYHTINDTADNCNFGYCREIAGLNCAVLVYSAWQP